MTYSAPALLLLLAVPVLGSAQAASQGSSQPAAVPVPLPALPRPTLDRVRAAKSLTCGISREEEDYSRAEDHGNRAAFDIDLCKAVAVAVLGPGARLVVKSFPDEPFAVRALRAGEVDLLATASPSVANMALDVAFSAPVLQDGQGFLLPKNPAVRSPLDLAGKKVCFLTGSHAEEGLHRYAADHNVSYTWFPFSEAGEMEAAFFTGNCDAVTSDLTQLANIRAIDARPSRDFTILPQIIRPDPLAMATWAGDTRFSAIVYWTVQALLGAEVRGMTQAGAVDFGTATQTPEAQQFAGQTFGTGAMLDLHDRWVAEVIGAVGNYGELFERDLGAKSRLRLERGANRLSTQSGQLLEVPLREH